MKRKKIKLLSLIAAAVMSLALLSGCGSTTVSFEDALAQLEYDEEAAPDETRQVVVLSGSWKDMGRQYAEQVPDVVKRNVASGLSSVLSEHSEEEANAALQKHLDYYDEYTPEVREFFEGVAEGSGIDFETVALGLGGYSSGGFCSTMAAWGDTTEDGRLIAGGNWDTESGDSYFEPAVIAYPEDGYAFVAGSGFFSNVVMNEKGVVLMGSSGQSAREEDTGVGMPVISPPTFLAAKCESAEEAKDLYIDGYTVGTGDNFHVVDTTGASYVVEHTADKDCVRTSGDFDEEEYTIATNDFMIDEMQECLYSGEDYWDDNRPRYWTEEQILLENYSDVSTDTIADALGSTDFYIPENWEDYDWHPMFSTDKLQTGWNRDVWNLDEYQGYWTPENREPSLKAVARNIADPENSTLYIMNGCENTLVSANPDATGNFMHLTLNEDIMESVSEAYSYALMQNWLAARDISNSSGNTTEREEYLDQAKEAVIAGESYMYKAEIASDEETKLKYCGKALTKFCEAECYGQLAQDNPTKIAREGGDY